ncbi:zinc ribbon domain-containing protein [Clostridium sp. CTA-5]
MEKKQFVCPKCGNQHYESDQFQATGGNFAKIFDVQNKKFITVSCTRCGYTELYKAQSGSGWNILDFLMG